MSEPKEYYYICQSCAKTKGLGEIRRGATLHEDICPYCREKKFLAARFNDFEKESEGVG